MTHQLPKFNQPPVIETVLGLDFDTVAAWQVPHFGLFWHEIRSRYEHFAVQPPLPSSLERFEREPKEVSITLSAHPNVRCWFYDHSNTWLLQVQNNRFISNWKSNPPNYPNYEGFYSRFIEEWERFGQFVANEDLGDLRVRQAEVSYINHIHTGGSFDFFQDIFPFWRGFSRETEFIKNPEALVIKGIFLIPENKGRLHVDIEPVVRHSDLEPVLQLSLTARVRVASNEDISACLSLAHEWVVRGFAEITSSAYHKKWDRVV